MLKKTVFKISGMHCTSCALSIDIELEDLKGIKESNTNYAKQQTKVVFDENKIKLVEITEKISEVGYEVVENLSL